MDVRAFDSCLLRVLAARPGWLYPCRSRRFSWPSVLPGGHPGRPEDARSCFLAREPFLFALAPPVRRFGGQDEGSFCALVKVRDI